MPAQTDGGQWPRWTRWCGGQVFHEAHPTGHVTEHHVRKAAPEGRAHPHPYRRSLPIAVSDGPGGLCQRLLLGLRGRTLHFCRRRLGRDCRRLVPSPPRLKLLLLPA